MSEIKLVLTDFDGTVVEFGDHVVSDNVRQTVIACEEKGIQVVPVTGRYYEMARPVLGLLGFDGYGVFDNGATIQHCKTGETVWKNWLDAPKVRKVAHVLAKSAILIDYSAEHEEGNHVPADNEHERIDMIDEPASHIYAVVPKLSLPEIEEQLAEIPDISYYRAPDLRGRREYVGIQVNDVQSSKYYGAWELQNLVGIYQDSTLAIGDGDNDLPLFDTAAIKVAMGNGSDALKERADFITGSVQNDGFVEAMQKFVL